VTPSPARKQTSPRMMACCIAILLVRSSHFSASGRHRLSAKAPSACRYTRRSGLDQLIRLCHRRAQHKETDMKTELFYLLLTAILTGVLWIPVVIGYVVSRGPLTPEVYKKAPTSTLPDWVNRANRAHLNAVENFAQFASV